MASKTNISGIGGTKPGHTPKTSSPDAITYVQDNGLTPDQYVSKDDWNTLVDATKELQEADDNNVKGVRFNQTVYRPDEDGIVTFSQAGNENTYFVRINHDIDNPDAIHYVKIGDAIPVNFRYSAYVRDTGGDNTLYNGEAGKLVITRRMTGGATETVYTRNDLTAISEESTLWNVSLDLANYLVEGSQTLTFTFSVGYTLESSGAHVASSSISFQYNIINLTVKNEYNWANPIDFNTYANAFPIVTRISGKTEKYLHIEIRGKTQNSTHKVVITYSASQEGEMPIVSLIDTDNTGFLKHGIHNVRLWLTCDDGSGHTDADGYYDGIVSEEVKYRVLVLSNTPTALELTTTYVILQDVKTSATNFTQETLTQFAIWRSNPTGATIAAKICEVDPTLASENIIVKLTDFVNGGGYENSYVDMKFTGISANTPYTITTPIEIDADENTSTIATYLRFIEETSTEQISDILEKSKVLNFSASTDVMLHAYIVVNNTAAYLPTSGATFYLNPKTRSNTDADWKTIKNNARKDENGNPVVVSSVWENFNHSTDGWIRNDENIGILRILAGEKIKITGDEVNAFSQFNTNGSAQLTFEIECMIKNVTNNDDPIIKLSTTDGNDIIGITMNPLEGYFRCKNQQGSETHNFRWAEDRRTHFIFTINPQVDTRDNDIRRYSLPGATAYSLLPLARVYINGKCNRAFTYSAAPGIWSTGSAMTLELGQSGADIDIYHIRIYKGNALSANAIRQNIIATRPTVEEKNKIMVENDICDSNGHVVRDYVHDRLHRNTLTLHSERDIWKGVDRQKQPCYLEIHMYDHQTGEYQPQYSGYIGKKAYDAYKNGTPDAIGRRGSQITTYQVKTQGSTAATYWWHNWQGKANDIEFKVDIPFSTVHPDFNWKPKESSWEAGENPADVEFPMFLGEPSNGGVQIQGNDYAGLDEADKANVWIRVDDGWFDGNNIYHGQLWKPSEKSPRMKKLCNKINYASSMGHHKKGAVDLINDVMYKILREKNCLPLSHNPDVNPDAQPNARFCVEEIMMYYFHQNEYDSNPDMQGAFYHGPCSFGAGKADKPTWGYDEKDYPLMCLFEGADNNVELTDFLIPFCDAIHYYDTAKGDWSYAMIDRKDDPNGKTVLAWDFDMGYEKEELGQNINNTDTEKYAPSDAIEAEFRKFVDFWYCHNTRFTYTSLSIDNYNALYNSSTTSIDDKATMRKSHVWSTQDYCMYRFDYNQLKFVNAGTWDQNTLSCNYTAVRNLSTYGPTAQAYQTWLANGTGDPDVLNMAFRQAMADELKRNIEAICCTDSFLTGYNVIQQLLTGSDNCSKNTYFTLCPVSLKKDANGNQIYCNAEGTNFDLGVENGGRYTHPAYNYKWYVFTDDVDTVHPADNTGQMTKVWFSTRMNDKWDTSHGLKRRIDFEGAANVMFNSIEDTFDDNLTSEVGVSGTKDTELQLNMTKVLTAVQSLSSAEDYIVGFQAESSLMATWWKYFLQWAEYFPMVAFNEAGRVKYEYPMSMNYMPQGAGARNVTPLDQHCGDQLECEIDFLQKRSVYFAMYAMWGEMTGSSGIGVGDANDNFTITHRNGDPDTQIVMDIKASRPMYATGSMGNSTVNPHVRLVPGQGNPGMPAIYHFLGPTATGDKGATVYGINYYNEIGNIGDYVVDWERAATITGKRLTKLDITPTNNQSERIYKPSSLVLNAPNLEVVRIKSSGLRGILDLEKCVRLRECDFEGSNLNQVKFAECTTLKQIRFGSTITTLVLRGLVSLETLTFLAYNNISSITTKNIPKQILQTVLNMISTLIV